MSDTGAFDDFMQAVIHASGGECYEKNFGETALAITSGLGATVFARLMPDDTVQELVLTDEELQWVLGLGLPYAGEAELCDSRSPEDGITKKDGS